jgi:4-amino-4-deoxychorismate lyase
MHVTASGFAQWNRAVAYGDGLFESILVVDGVAPLWQYHKLRLQQSLERLCISCDVTALEKKFHSEISDHPDALIKIIVARSGGDRGYSARQANKSAVKIISYPLPQFSRTRMVDGVRMHVCRQRLSHNPALAGIKHLNRLEQVLAFSELDRAIADEGLMLDNCGTVIEGTASNIFILRNQTLVTPLLDHCGVAGVMREYIIRDLAATIPLSIRQSRLTLADVLSSDAVFICNSVFGVWPVRSVGVSQLSFKLELIEDIWRKLTPMGYASLYD